MGAKDPDWDDHRDTEGPVCGTKKDPLVMYEMDKLMQEDIQLSQAQLEIEKSCKDANDRFEYQLSVSKRQDLYNEVKVHCDIVLKDERCSGDDANELCPLHPISESTVTQICLHFILFVFFVIHTI